MLSFILSELLSNVVFCGYATCLNPAGILSEELLSEYKKTFIKTNKINAVFKYFWFSAKNYG